jgi:hypothetical protein
MKHSNHTLLIFIQEEYFHCCGKQALVARFSRACGLKNFETRINAITDQFKKTWIFPQVGKELYKTVWEMSMNIIDMSRRGYLWINRNRWIYSCKMQLFLSRCISTLGNPDWKRDVLLGNKSCGGCRKFTLNNDKKAE